MQLEVRLEGTLEAQDQLLLMVQSTGGGAVTKAVTKGIEKNRMHLRVMRRPQSLLEVAERCTK